MIFFPTNWDVRMERVHGWEEKDDWHSLPSTALLPLDATETLMKQSCARVMALTETDSPSVSGWQL